MDALGVSEPGESAEAEMLIKVTTCILHQNIFILFVIWISIICLPLHFIIMCQFKYLKLSSNYNLTIIIFVLFVLF